MLTSLSVQFQWLLLLAIPIACISWTVTHEEIFREPREYCVECSKNSRTLLARKFFYVFTCEYCFSHYVTLVIIIFCRFNFLYSDWRGFILGLFSLVWIANVYMSAFAFLRMGIKKEKVDISIEE